MNRDQFHWAVFVAVLVPLFLRQPTDPLWVTAAHMAICFCIAAVAVSRAR
jgi:hypothetical protein